MFGKRSHPLRSILLPMLLLIGLVMSSTPPLEAAAPSAPGASRTVILEARADAMVLSTQSTTNYGAGSLGVTNQAQSYVWFALGNIPARATIESAILQLMPADIVGPGPNTINVGRVLAAWDENAVTWDSKPGVGQNQVSTSVGSIEWQSWNVTPLVQAWQAGTFDNYGFGLVTDGAGVYFDSRETLPAPRLVVTLTIPDDDDPDKPVPPNNPFSDLGDAPDSTNNHGLNNTAYLAPVVLGQFPTVYQGTAAGAPAGPRHANPTIEAFLGDNITREQGADGGADADGVNNILRTPGGGVVDTADHDRGDDGWRNYNVPLENCQRADLVVKVRRGPAAQLDKMLLNVYIDGEHDGEWEDTGLCKSPEGQQARSYEWIVQNQPVDLSAIPPGSSGLITVSTLLIHNPHPNKPHWMRFMLSEKSPPVSPVTGLSDGRGFHPGGATKVFTFGEVEDLLYRPSPQGEVGDVTIDKQVVVPQDPVGYGETVTYKIRVKHTGGSRAVTAEMRDVLDYPLHLIGGIQVREILPGVSPLNARLERRLDRSGPRPVPQTRVRWRGTLAPDAEVEISFDVHVHPYCPAGSSTKTIRNTATLHKADGTKVGEKSVDFEAACPGISLNDINVTQSRIQDVTATGASMSIWDDPDIVHRQGREVTFTNKGSESTTLAFKVEIAPAFLPTIPNEAVQAAGEEEQSACQTLTLKPGESKTLDVWTDMRPLSVLLEQFPDDPGEEIVLTSRVVYVMHYPHDNGSKGGNLCAAFQIFDEAEIGQNEAQYLYRPYDVGDAPDSTNHAGVAMTAYAGVTADFPTVFDVATGAPEGPAHARPRPFHLGRRVEIEPDADLGPMPRNILPPLDIPNRDRFDDGTRPGTWSFSDCDTTTIEVQVAISPAAAAWFAQNGNTGYLNGFFDFNRDGDWEDTFTCAPADNLPSYALEHFIIDAPVDVGALGAGLHLLTVSTGRVSWPAELAEQAAWARLTLSERPSNKPFTTPTEGIQYGDGRGFAQPFLAGETEDYLWKPAGQGADPALDLDLEWQPLFEQATAEGNGSASSSGAYEVILRMRIENRGQEDAQDVGVSIPSEFPVLLKPENLLAVSITGETGSGISDGTDIVRPALSEDAVRQWLGNPGERFNIGTLGAGKTIIVFASWKIEEGVKLQGAAASAPGFIKIKDIVGEIISSGPDADPSNNKPTAGLEIADVEPTLGFASPDGPYALAEAVTSMSKVELRGTAPPETKLAIFTDGFESGDVTSLADGSWKYLLTGLSDGEHLVQVSFENSVGEQVVTEGILVVDSSQPIDPLSAAFYEKSTTGLGAAFPPGALQALSLRNDVFVPGRVYTFMVRATDPQNPPTEVTYRLRFGGQEGEEVVLTLSQWEFDSDGVASEEFTVPAAARLRGAGSAGQSSLTIVTQSGEQTNEGNLYTTTEGQITDRATGQAIEDALVFIMVRDNNRDGKTQWRLWNGADAGQANPATSNAMGDYLFVPDPGWYSLLIVKEGYQSYFSAPFELAAGEAVARNIALAPAVEGQADITVGVGEGGFSLPDLRLRPGSIIRWLNTDTVPHGIEVVSQARNGETFESGLLQPGESFHYAVQSAGRIRYRDITDPNSVAVLDVDPNAPVLGMKMLYMPSLHR